LKTWIPSPILLFFLAALLTACGSSAPRSLQTVSISPATADAHDFASGEVQFTATGYYNKSPMQVAPMNASWGACYQNQPTTDVTMTATGIARCAPGASGTYLVWAFAPDGANMTCSAVNACGGGCGRLTGTALLTCP
jgi:hypothetical protein